ncbi:ABC transporter ATP-binding protein [Haloarcula amylolytica]|uniref:Cobalamin import ATP-binding protein BtuD n=1 Tax=Haloarcula amylolytica JCM 13557 TaxID=1227452 RepID=M0K1G3_9EURY|nr:ABC transporter ATP-binding protein [Haloarcula amylolytica]EMA13969.1 ABC transporter [Haloarcula amylolytica JCM 13557]
MSKGTHPAPGTDATEAAEASEPSRPVDSDSNDSDSITGQELVLSYSSSEEPVIDDESITARSGAVTALVGPNGSGKSTLLKGMADQLTPDHGSVILQGRDVHSYDTKELAQKLGLLSQESVAPDSITVEDLVYHGRYPHRGFFESVSAEDERAVDRALTLAGCEHLRDREVGQLSGGQKQLAWIAMVIAQDTDILLLDEPTTFLDLHHQLEVMEIIDTLRNKSDITIIVVLHDIQQAARIADKMIALKSGEVRARGTPEEIVTKKLLAEVFDVEAKVQVTDRGPRIEPLSPLNSMDN